ncbi:MAG: YbjN domain-containing protein, partial [Candidatus Peribacteraceae bacterium]|nr:YbjN domain-containing protein [Candidatus Peribacteraceae bacterium]
QMNESKVIGLDNIKDFLKRYGWQFKEVEKDIILTDFVTKEDNINFIIIIRFAPPWIRINIPAFLEIPNEEALTKLSKHLVKLNYLTRQAYFSLTEKDDLTLCIDLYMKKGLVYEQFEAALDILTYVTEKSFTSLMDFINNTKETED